MKRFVWMYGNSYVIMDDNYEVKMLYDVIFGEVFLLFFGRYGK